MFEDRTVEGIKKRILGRITTNLQTREGSFTNDVISAASAEICEVYHSMDAFLPAFYLDETSGEYIDKQAAGIGIIRKAGTLARCVIHFQGADGAQIPAGTPFYTAAGLSFYLEDAITIVDGTAEGSLVAAAVGDAYNIAADEITATLRNYSGITAYENEMAEGGADAETDEALLSRLNERRRRSATSGNPFHYQSWATSVDGIGAARVISKWDGPGSVKVVVANADMEPAEAEAVEKCAAYIEEQRPVGPSVTVVAAEEMPLTVSASVSIEGSTTKEMVKNALEAAVRSYLQELAKDAFNSNIDMALESLEDRTYTILFNRIAYLLLSIPGVVDYDSLLVGGGTDNITVNAVQLPVLTEVIVS